MDGVGKHTMSSVTGCVCVCCAWKITGLAKEELLPFTVVHHLHKKAKIKTLFYLLVAGVVCGGGHIVGHDP